MDGGALLTELCGMADERGYPALHTFAAYGAKLAGCPLPHGLIGISAWDRAAPQARQLDIGNLPWPQI